MTEPNTHLKIDRGLCGEILELGEGRAEVELTTDARMSADDRGLVHGGFIFGAADYAAMLAVNDPNVVLGAANVTFTAPTRVGERVHVRATVRAQIRRKYDVGVQAHVGAVRVFEGSFTCFVLDHHVLDKEG
ncbi:hotdog domain-containing protein [Enhygromyxa salina]|uniref:Fatty acid biosynthesis transcriptional regulator n=1 Tax=Enhygromyxa salina TaxID=215803 RepID=A0A2S9YTS2_9BACT|nr:hotdog domain-containing protein [Enhygromyxa salina]PRQ08488.1 fatty acid biosynthesis transcriptional regulator [Enhygromyxa salina]